MKPKPAGGTAPKTNEPKAHASGTLYSDKLKGTGKASESRPGSEAESSDGTRKKVFKSPAAESLALKKLQVKLTKLKSQPQSLGKIKKQPVPKSKQKDLASQKQEVLDLGALANVSMSVVKETVAKFAVDQAERQAAVQKQFA